MLDDDVIAAFRERAEAQGRAGQRGAATLTRSSCRSSGVQGARLPGKVLREGERP